MVFDENSAKNVTNFINMLIREAIISQPYWVDGRESDKATSASSAKIGSTLVPLNITILH